MAAPGGAADEASHPATGLLELPVFLQHEILGHLSAAADLAAVAASCTALRALVRGSTWAQAGSLTAHVWTPALPPSLAWAAAHLPQVWLL